MKLFHAMCAAALLLMAVPAHAITPVWSSNAASCVPDPETIRLDRHAVTGSMVTHRAGNVDPIGLFCHISDPPINGSQWNLVVTYRDSTGTGTTANVLARLFRVMRTTGGQVPLATFSSNSSSATTMGKGQIGFTHTFNFDTNYYYVLLTLDRTATTEIVQVVGVAIEPNIP